MFIFHDKNLFFQATHMIVTSSRIKIGKVGDRTKKFVRVKIKYPSVMQMKSPAARTVTDVVRSKVSLRL